MELEALLLGLEPIVALSVGVAALVLAPVIGSLANPEFGQNVSEGGRNLVKDGLKMSMETLEKVQTSLTEATESWNSLVAEAKSERELSRNVK